MKALQVAVAILFSLCSTAIMSYISMATPIGPWIETTLVLGALLIFSLVRTSNFVQSLGLTTAAGGIGGILATGIGFSFPTLYFIDQATFVEWMKNPWYFSLVVGALSLAAGAWGMLIAHICESKFIIQEKLAFPIGELVYKMISVQNQLAKAVQLAGGFLGTTAFLYIQQCFSFMSRQLCLIPQPLPLFGGITIPSLIVSFDVIPMFLAVGFITGHVIALPLLLGLAAKFLCIDPLHYYYPTLYAFVQNYILSFVGLSSSYKPINAYDFSIAFGSGIVLYGAVGGLTFLPSAFYKMLKNGFSAKYEQSTRWSYEMLKKLPWLYIALVYTMTTLVLFYFQFSLLAQLYLLTFTTICTYQMLYIAGKIGLAPLGRFATFVLVPALFLFNLTPVQITVIATFVEIAGGVACDTLFGRKMARLASFEHASIVWFQWLGLLVSVMSVGLICWLLIAAFGLGNELGQLAVNKALGRALLINCKNFDFSVLGMGFIFGYLLTFTRVSPVLVLGGILMQPNLSLLLITGGFLASLVKSKKEDYYPLWSGVFAANSLWMIIKAFLGNFS